MGYLSIISKQLDYIDDHKNVDCIKTKRNGRKLSLVAHLTDGNEIQLTHNQSVLTYPYEPFMELMNCVGRNYINKFAIIANDYVAINKENLENIAFASSNEKNVTDIIAHFKSGNAVRLYGVKDRYLNEERCRLLEYFGDKYSFEMEAID